LTEQGKRALALKGAPIEESPDRSVDSAQVLQMYRDKKAVENETELEKLEKQLIALIIKKLGSM